MTPPLSKFLPLALLLGLLPFASGAPTETDFSRDLRQLTKEFDLFDRLAAFPEQDRPVAALDTGVCCVASIARHQLQGLKNIPPASLTAEQTRDLQGTAAVILQQAGAVLEIRRRYQPDLTADLRRKLDALQLIYDSAPHRSPFHLQPNPAETPTLLTVLTQISQLL